MEERRLYIRINTPILIEFPRPGTMKTERSFTHDVSESGMRFPTAVKLDISQQLPLTLHIPFQDAMLQATGEVVWIREIARHGSPQYDVGVRFLWIEDPDRQRLLRHLTSIFQRRA